jgi:hypothetical protein
MAIALTNAGFEAGNAIGWTLGPGMSVSSTKKFAGTYSVQLTGDMGDVRILHDKYPAAEGRVINASCQYKQGNADTFENVGAVIIQWLDAADAVLREDEGNIVDSGIGGAWHISSITTPASPAGTKFVRIGLRSDRTDPASDHYSYVDQFIWNYDFDRSVTLTSPADGASFELGTYVQMRVDITGTSPAVASVSYYDDVTLLKTLTVSPYGYNEPDLTVGSHPIRAVVTFVDSTTLSTATHIITIVDTPDPPDTREYKASNSYAYLVSEGISGISSSIPAVAKVTAVEAVIDYEIAALIRSKDLDVVDPVDSDPNVAFDITDGGTVQMVMVEPNGDTYTKQGNKLEVAIPLDRADFDIVEEGTSEGKKWTVMEGTAASVTIGSEDDLFGLSPVAMTDFATKGFALRFLPVLQAKPTYADSGDCVFRFKVNKLRFRIYFDAGSVEYYFASPDKSDVLKGRLVSAEVTDGNFETSDASGILQLASDLEVVLGDATAIGCDWTIHAAYPPTAANQIGDVAGGPDCEYGMSYNGLPTQQQVRDNRSRYVMITANFFGDKDLNSIYGAHGLPRAFAYNGDFFYNIYTQPDADKDKPRHVAYHHAHLALGFEEGRVDISVAGKPWSFDGVLGATSWAIGDAVVGLLPLSGTILGVFGAKSVWGISGTTSENFATQVISPNIGATEYTICDMGFPVYANAYGVYTLAQVQQYGDYMGQPMSADVSPWLRPRLLRKLTSPAEVVVAWPVRSKNQYRLAFSDGYVMSMTLNGQQVPTFSFQKYFYTGSTTDPYISDDLYSYPTIVPAAVSSQLDESGEERIHVAPYVNLNDIPPYVPPEPPTPAQLFNNNGIVDEGDITDAPEWFVWSQDFSTTGATNTTYFFYEGQYLASTNYTEEFDGQLLQGSNGPWPVHIVSI